MYGIIDRDFMIKTKITVVMENEAKAKQNVIDEAVWNMVETYQGELDDEAEIRDSIRTVIRGLERSSKKVHFVLMAIHGEPNKEQLNEIGLKCEMKLKEVIHPLMITLKEKVPVNSHYKFNDHWRIPFQKLSAMSVMTHFIKENTVPTIQQVADLMGVVAVGEKEEKSLIFLDFEEYLVGLLETASELARMSRNCITFGNNIPMVFRIHQFMTELSQGLHCITFKNDYLRKRYDGLKYDVKIVEEVIYDLKLRGITDGTAHDKLNKGGEEAGSKNQAVDPKKNDDSSKQEPSS